MAISSHEYEALLWKQYYTCIELMTVGSMSLNRAKQFIT